MNISIRISTTLGTFGNSIEIFELMLSLINFEISSSSSSVTQKSLRPYFEEDFRDEIKNKDISSIYLVSDGDVNKVIDEQTHFEIIRFSKEHLCFNCEFIYISVDKIESINWNKLLDIANNYIFSTIYMSSVSRSKWQNETQINFFDYFKHPHNYTHTKPNPISMKFGNIVDIFYNPGHERKVYGMYLMAAPEMWFGQNALVYFEKQKLLSFPDVIENKELENGTIYIKLFDYNEPNWETPKILDLQKRFREWTSMNEIELMLREKIPNQYKILE
jgi:hypothetical protein